MRFLPTAVHAVLDYTVGLALAASPWLFGFAAGGPETWLPVALGLGALAYSALTRYELGVVYVLPMSAHLWLDGLSGVLLAASPWLFHFADHVWLPHVLFGLLEVAVSLLTRTTPDLIGDRAQTPAGVAHAVTAAPALSAAPPDDGGHLGSFTRPDDMLQVRHASDAGQPAPPLASDSTAARLR